MSKATKFRFTTTECTRCGGTGRYSYTQLEGDRCRGCLGTGKRHDRAGKLASAAYEAWKTETYTVAASAVRPGDRILMTYPRRVWATVTEVTTTLGNVGGRSSQGAPGTDDYTEFWQLGKTVLETAQGGYQTAAHAPTVALPPVAEFVAARDAWAATLPARLRAGIAG